MGKGVCIGTRTMELEAPATLLHASHFAMRHSMPVALATVAWNLRDLPPVKLPNYTWGWNCRGVICWHRRYPI